MESKRVEDPEIEKLNKEIEALRQTRERLVQKANLLWREALHFSRTMFGKDQLEAAVEGMQKEIVAAYDRPMGTELPVCPGCDQRAILGHFHPETNDPICVNCLKQYEADATEGVQS